MLCRLKLILIFLLLTIGYFSTKASVNSSVFFDNYNEDQGLVHNYILCLYQDSRGILWVGTYGGVQAFNGYNFNMFNVSGKKSNILTNHVVNVIYEDRDNNLWFGTESGLNKYNLKTGEITQYLHNRNDLNSLSHNNVRTIFQDAEGVFWIGTYGGGLNRFDEKQNKFEHFRAKLRHSEFLQSDLINAFYVDNNGLYWIGTENGGVSVFDKRRRTVVETFTKGKDALTHATVSCIFQDNKDNFWIGTWGGGLNKYNPYTRKFTYFNYSDPTRKENGNIITKIVQTENNFLWISSFGEGLYKLDLATEQLSKIKISALKEGNSSQEIIWTLLKDNTNNLWVGTFGKGLFKENDLKSTFPYYSIKQPDDLNLSISSIVEDQSQKLWISTLNRGMYLYDLENKSYSRFTLGQLKNDHISKLYIDRENRMWVGTDDALYVIMPDRKKLRRFANDPQKPNSISESEVNALIEDSKGNIWIGFWGTGIQVIEKNELEKNNDNDVVFSKYMMDDTSSFLHSRIWNFYEDSKQTIWVGTSGDLAYFNPDTKNFNWLPIKVASAFYEDSYGYLWIGSIGYGLYKIDKNKTLVKKYTTKDGLPTLDVLAIQKDKKGRMWLGTSIGLSLFDPKSENISNFDKNYGLQNFSISHNAFTTLSNGKLVFGGNNGFNVFTSEDISQDFIPSPIIISDIKLNNKSIVYENVLDSSFSLKSSVAYLDTLLLNYKNKVITIDFAAVNYTIPSGITYAYKLDGFDEDWVITDANNRSATYTNLDEGEYVFSVKMSYNKGKWTENSRKLRIIITPPFWNMWWFKILASLAGIAIVWFLLWIKLGRNKLAMIINQKQVLTEKLTSEQELLQLRYDQLKETLNQYHKKSASVSLNYQVVRDYMDVVRQNLLELKSSSPNPASKKISQLIQEIDEKLTELGEVPDFNDNFNILYNDFVKRFAETYPKLTPTDLKICSLIRMNKSNKEIARQLSITLGSLETSRHRIRKKINLASEINLNDHILRF